ncbi:MAG: single-strand DNA-binding protein [Parcubacteria group bacterium Gr01-1014_29]|nr:MAG: single-strand DNA-binding protein [Parcubacteria group bacterium Gr01-1014_29]
MNLNRVLLIGNLTRDPEMRSLPSGQPVINFGLATNRIWKDKEGQKQQQVEFHNIVAFGKPAELIHQYMRKGSSLYVDGRLQTRSWDGPDGNKRSRTEVVVENFQFGPRAAGSQPYAGEQPPQANQQQSPSQDDVATVEYPDDEVNPEEIPF